MLEYKEVTMEDKEWVEKIFKKCNRRGNEYTFSNLFNWSVPQNVKIAPFEDCIIFKHMAKSSTYSCPIGNGSLPKAIEVIMEESHQHNEKLSLINVDEFDVEAIEKHFPGRFKFEERRDDFDYIYETEDLGNLKGRKHHVKRNHMNKFLSLYPDWRFEEITKDNIHLAREMAEEWYKEAFLTKTDTIVLEKQSVDSGFDHYFELGLTGGILFVGDEVAAFTWGNSSSDDTMVVHCEKAFTKFESAYTMITKEFSKFVSKKYKYINREDDMGVEGLRISKLSYRPAFFYKRYKASEV